MNLQNMLEAAPSFLWSDGSDVTGLAMTAKLFLLSVVPGLVSDPQRDLLFPQYATVPAIDADLLRPVAV